MPGCTATLTPRLGGAVPYRPALDRCWRLDGWSSLAVRSGFGFSDLKLGASYTVDWVGTIADHGSLTMADTACPVRGLPIFVVDQTLSDLLALCPLLEGETAADAAIDDGPPVCTWI
ncbi:hypothetical protein ACLOJK_037081 [Asimina triloba]